MPKIASAEIIINEVMYSPAKGGIEWIELFNNGSLNADLSSPDIRFYDGTNHLLSVSKNGGRGSLILLPGEYALLADDALSLATSLLNYSGTIIDTVMSLNNTSDTLKIINTKSTTDLASMFYEKNMGAAGNGKSLEWDGAALKESSVDGGTPGQTNSVLTNGATPSAAPSASPTESSATPTPTPAAPSYEYSQKVFINEFLSWPEDNAKEWVELFNADSSAINLSGWQIDDADNSTSPQVIPADTTIDANGFLVISFNKNALNNDGDKVRLLWPDDQVVHSVTYDKSQQGRAVAKFDSGWLWTNQPTPGQTNKKSFVEKNEVVLLASAPSNKIMAIEEAVAIQVGAPSPDKTAISRKSPTMEVSTENNISQLGEGAPTDTLTDNNLAAATGEPLKSNSSLESILALAGVIALSSLAAGGLIYFRRQKQFDIESPDD
ncbi:MAG: lamin tail domain-containing protein [Candidatus Portnoybacteria bacterium]|nr:lamin tail domain-containing protein [Candidatus Portnoybacteria bacterium]MDD4982704.1 lamin tail domain-containing protein [Candidatus Portnoybacteria bacterium]